MKLLMKIWNKISEWLRRLWQWATGSKENSKNQNNNEQEMRREKGNTPDILPTWGWKNVCSFGLFNYFNKERGSSERNEEEDILEEIRENLTKEDEIAEQMRENLEREGQITIVKGDKICVYHNNGEIELMTYEECKMKTLGKLLAIGTMSYVANSLDRIDSKLDRVTSMIEETTKQMEAQEKFYAEMLSRKNEETARQAAKQNGVDLHQQAANKDSQQGNSFTEMEKERKDSTQDMTRGL